MKKFILGILMIGFFTFSSFAQGRKGQKKIEAQKVAFITNYLELTPEESAVFWPVYKQYEKDKRAIRKQYKRTEEIEEIEKMTDAELEAQMLSSFQRDQKQLDLKKEYFEKLKEVLSMRKIAKLRVAEKEFKTTILDVMRKRRKERRMQQNN